MLTIILVAAEFVRHYSISIVALPLLASFLLHSAKKIEKLLSQGPWGNCADNNTLAHAQSVPIIVSNITI
jgi:hypothetical protein